MANATRRRVKSWAPTIRRVREDYGMSEDTYPDALALALIDIESDGYAKAHRKGRQFWGILQIGKLSGKDQGFVPSTMADMTDAQAGKVSIEHFYKQLKKYRRTHENNLEWIAVMWNAGPTPARIYKRLIKAGKTEEGEAYLRSINGGEPYRYLRDFRREYRYWNTTGKSVPGGASPGSSRVGTNSTPTEPGTPAAAATPAASRGAIPAQITAARAPNGALVQSIVTRTLVGCDLQEITTRVAVAEVQGITTRTAANVVTTTVSVAETRGPAPTTVRGGPPLPKPRRVRAAPPAAVARARGTKTSALEYLQREFRQNLAVYKAGAYARMRANNGITPAGYRTIARFVDAARSGKYDDAFLALFRDGINTWVKPLVDATPGGGVWGKPRNFSAGASRADGKRKAKMTDPESGELLWRRHQGVDFATRLSPSRIDNQPVYAIADGTVAVCGWSNSYGYVVILRHDGGLQSRYAHLKERPPLRVGQRVRRAQRIATTGATEGRKIRSEDGSVRWIRAHNGVFPHLHFELRYNIGVLKGTGYQGGVWSKAHNISFDPVPIFSVCPNPGEARPVIEPRLQALLDGRDAAAETVNAATTVDGRQSAQQAYDEATGRLRGYKLTLLGRADFYAAEEQRAQREIQRVATGTVDAPQNFQTSES